MNEQEGNAATQIPLGDISAEALRALVESFIGREGTDYGAVERSLDEKVADVMDQLDRGEVEIWFDPETESVNLVPAPEAGQR